MDDITFVPALAYRDPKAALDWLEQAFDFELTMAIDGPDDDPSQCHYEMAYEGRGRIMIGGEWNEWMRSPALARRAQHDEHARRGDPRHRRALCARPRRRRRDPRRTGRPVLRRPGLPVRRSGGAPLDVRHACPRRPSRRGGGRHRHTHPRAGLAVSTASAARADDALDATLDALADPVRRRFDRTPGRAAASRRRARERARGVGTG